MVVGLRLREAEGGHDGVADELVEHAALVLDAVDHQREVLVQHADRRLRPELLGERGEPPDVGEQQRDDGAGSPEDVLAAAHQPVGEGRVHVAGHRRSDPLLAGDVLQQEDGPLFVRLDAQRHTGDVDRRGPGSAAAADLEVDVHERPRLARGHDLLDQREDPRIVLEEVVDRPPDDLVLRIAQDLGSGGVARHDLALVVEGDHPVGHRLQHGVVVVLHALDVVEQLGVLEGDGDLGGECPEPLLVLSGEGTAPLVQRLGRPDRLSGLVDERDAQDRSGEEAGLGVERRVEPQVGVGVGDVDRLAAGEHRAGDADRVGKSDLHDAVVPFGDPGDEFRRPAVVQEQGGPLGVEHRRRLGHHPQQQRVEVDLGRDVGDEIDELHLLGRLRLPSLVALDAREGQRRLRCHRLEQLQVGIVEPVGAVQDLGDPDQFTPTGTDRRAQDLPGRVAGRLVDLGIEVGVGVGVVDHHAAPGP